MGISGVCSRLIGDLVQVFGGGFRPDSARIDHGPPIISKPCDRAFRVVDDDVMLRALITVFGMQENGRIKKEKARGVVEKLGLLQGEEEKAGFELPRPTGQVDGGDDEVAVEDVIGEMEEESKRSKLLQEAFKIFDVDGDGFIDTVELKRVLECLGLDKGWGIREIEKMVSVVDVNSDGKVDFTEFELMMGVKCPYDW